MYYLYGSKKAVPRKLVATFSSQQQLLAYLRWATLAEGKFEQGSALAGYSGYEHAAKALTDEDEQAVLHNPTPTML